MKMKFGTTLILVLSLIVSGAFGFAWIQRTISKKAKELSELNLKLAILESEQKSISGLKKFLEEKKTDKDKLDKVFLSDEKIVEFIEELEKLSGAENVEIKIQSALVSEKQKENPVFNFELRGNFENIFRVMALMENLPYQLEIDEAGLTKEGKDKKWKGQFRIKILSFITSL